MIEAYTSRQTRFTESGWHAAPMMSITSHGHVRRAMPDGIKQESLDSSMLPTFFFFFFFWQSSRLHYRLIRPVHFYRDNDAMQYKQSCGGWHGIAQTITVSDHSGQHAQQADVTAPIGSN